MWGRSLRSGLSLTLSVSRCTDHLWVVNIAPSAVVSVAMALSLGSLLFPFSDSGFASFSAASSTRPLSLPPPLSSSSPASASLLSSLPPPTPAFPSPFAPPPFSSRSSFSASASLPPPPSGFPPLPLCFVLFLLSVLPLWQAMLPLLSFRPLPVWTSLRIRLQFWVCLMIISFWRIGIFSLGGSDFRAHLSAFYPHLSSDASRDFTYGSSVFFSALRSFASSFSVFCSSSSAVFHCFTLFLAFSSSFLRSFLRLSAFFSWFSFGSAGVGCVHIGVCIGGLFCSSGVSSSVCSFFSILRASACCFFFFFFSAPGCSNAYSTFLFLLFFGSSSSLWLHGSRVGLYSGGFNGSFIGSGSSAFPLPPFTVSDSQLLSSASASAPLSSAASGHAGFPPQPGPSSYIPPWSDSSAAPSAPHPLSLRLRIHLTVPSRLGLQIPRPPDPEAPVPPMLFDSICAEARLMYQYLVDLLLQPAGSIMSLLEEILCPLLLDNGTSLTILKIYLVYFRDIFRL